MTQPSLKPLSIGAVNLRNGLVMSPMAGITGAAFRSLCVEGGAGLVVTEMVSAESLRHANRKSFGIMRILPGEHPVAVQVFGSDPEAMAFAAEKAVEGGADIVDVNASCPVKKVLRSGAGAALMADPPRLAAIVSAMKKRVRVPVTAKVRCALREGELLGPALARTLQDAGADAVTVHARPASRFHNGPPDMEALRLTAAAVSIPVIGNGGVRDWPGAAAFLSAGCSGAALGRAAVENPFIFAEIEAAASGGSRPSPPPEERVRLFLRYIELNCGIAGPEHGVVAARKLVGYWLRGMPGSASVRSRFMTLKSLKEAEDLLIQYSGRLAVGQAGGRTA